MFPSTIGLNNHMVIFLKYQNSHGRGVALIVNNNFCPHELTVETTCELVALQICQPFDMIFVSVCRPPSSYICKFAYELLQIISQLDGSIPMGILSDFNKDILTGKQTHCCTKIESMDFKQMVEKHIRDSRTIIDHVYVTSSMNIVTDVSDCYYSNHDYVFCMLDI